MNNWNTVKSFWAPVSNFDDNGTWPNTPGLESLLRDDFVCFGSLLRTSFTNCTFKTVFEIFSTSLQSSWVMMWWRIGSWIAFVNLKCQRWSFRTYIYYILFFPNDVVSPLKYLYLCQKMFSQILWAVSYRLLSHKEKQFPWGWQPIGVTKWVTMHLILTGATLLQIPEKS